jgi:hypothetical protein
VSVARLADICSERGFQLHYPPIGGEADPTIRSVTERGPGVLTGGRFDLSPPTDDRPFFFQVVPVFHPVDLAAAREHGVNGEAVFVLQLLMITLATLTLILFFSPFVLSRWRPRRGEFWRGSVYFACIGMAFMLVEIPLLHRFILFLGHPSYATTVVLGSLLLGASVGSLVSSRLGVAWLRRWGMVVPALVATVNLLLPAIIEMNLGWELPARVGVAAVLLGPSGFLFGLFFPLGMLRFGDENKAWYWAMNGACSVIASVLSVALAMAFGYALVVWVGVACYALAIPLLRGAADDGPASTGHTNTSIRQEAVSMTAGHR